MKKVFLIFTVAGCLCGADIKSESEKSHDIKSLSKSLEKMLRKIKKGEIHEVADLDLDNVILNGKQATDDQKDAICCALLKWLRKNMTPEREALAEKVLAESDRMSKEHERAIKIKYLVVCLTVSAIACIAFRLFQLNPRMQT